jgi:hypothetical protein
MWSARLIQSVLRKAFAGRVTLLILAALNLLLPIPAANAGSQVYVSSGSWTAPAGVTSVVAEVWGGGGAGGGNATNADGGGGGGGGGYSSATVVVVPGSPYSFTVGGAGTGVAGGTGNPGGDSFFIDATTVMAKGGAGGNPPVAGAGGVGGAGGAAGSGVGTTKFSGGTGGTGRNNNTGRGGPGGSSAGTAADGTSGIDPWSTLIAAPPPSGGGIGGNGGAAGANGVAPASGNGGGGGGSGDTNATARTGGNGAGGKVVISWYPTVISINRANANPTGAASVFWTVTFSESVTGVDIGDFALVQAGGVSGATVTAVSGSGTTWTVTAGTGSGTGTLGLNLIDDNSIVDAGALPLGGTAAADGNFTGEAYTIMPRVTVAKSFAPSTIMAGANSVLTVTLTNPNASAVTGAAFTDSYPPGLVNAASANGTTTCVGGTVTAANGGGSVALSGGTIPASGSCTVTVNVTSTTAASYANNTGPVMTDSGSLGAAAATLIVDPAEFGRFNACDVATAPNANCTNLTTATTSRIVTKVAGTDFNLDLVALNNNGTRNTGYAATVSVQLLNSSDNSGALDANACRSTWSVITTLSPNPVFAAANNGLITVGPFNVANAYRDVRVRVNNVTGPGRIGCSTDNFAIRPNSLSFTVTDGNWETAGNSRALNNSGAPGGTVHKAGRPFTITATAYNAAGTPAITTNYAGTPSAGITSHIVPTACLNGTACTLSGGTFTDGTANDGTVSSATATYSEVGAFNMQLTDTSFADVDLADSSTAQRYITSATVAVGRFVPDHFTLASASRTPACTTGGSVLSYMDQPFTVAATLAAQNFAGTTTENYHPASGGYAPATVDWQAENADAGTNLGSRLANASATWSKGSYTVNSTTATFNRQTTPDGPYDSLQLGVKLTDPDGPVLGGLDMDAATGGACAPCTAKTVGAPISVRFGRLRLSGAYGSELLDVRLPVRAEYYAGAGSWSRNVADNCTLLPRASIALGNYLPPPSGTAVSAANMGIAPADHRPVSDVGITGGLGTIVLSKPSPAATGSFDVVLNLGTGIVSPNSCVTGTFVGGTAASLSFLLGNWCGSNHDRAPSARIKLGSPKAPYIYLRERY